MSKKSMPKELLVYVFDHDSETGEPLYMFALTVGEIPEYCHGEKVGVYMLNAERQFSVNRSLV